MTIALLDYPKANIRVVVETDFEKSWRSAPARKEPETTAWIDEYVQKGDVFYDIGANVGSYGFMAASRGAKVYAFEPEALNFARLCQNLSLNPDLDVTPLPVGLWEVCTVQKLYLKHRIPGAASASLTAPKVSNGNVQTQFITCLTLDVLDAFQIPLANHLKIDVDGYEPEVLAGGQMLLESPELRTVMAELNHADWDRFQQAGMALKRAGFVQKDEWLRSSTFFMHLFVRP